MPAPSTTAALQTWLQQFAHDAPKLDLFALLRHIDARAGTARLGTSHTPREDAVRLGQSPSTIFAPSTVHSISTAEDRAHIKTLAPGLFGPNGALPLHLSEYVRERLHNHADSAPADFVDIFHHRLISLFYRAWADAQATAQMDRPGLDKFSFYVGALAGMGFTDSWQRDSVADSAKLHAVGHLLRLTRNSEGLQQILGHFFNIDVTIDEYVPHRVMIDAQEQTTLSGMYPKNQLGVGAILGSSVFDLQSKFRIRLGPMGLAAFEHCLPPSTGNRQLRDFVRVYIGVELDWDVDLLLHANEVPRSQLGGTQRLGWTTWLGQRGQHTPADDVRLHPEKDAIRMTSAPQDRKHLNS